MEVSKGNPQGHYLRRERQNFLPALEVQGTENAALLFRRPRSACVDDCIAFATNSPSSECVDSCFTTGQQFSHITGDQLEGAYRPMQWGTIWV